MDLNPGSGQIGSHPDLQTTKPNQGATCPKERGNHQFGTSPPFWLGPGALRLTILEGVSFLVVLFVFPQRNTLEIDRSHEFLFGYIAVEYPFEFLVVAV